MFTPVNHSHQHINMLLHTQSLILLLPFTIKCHFPFFFYHTSTRTALAKVTVQKPESILDSFSHLLSHSNLLANLAASVVHATIIWHLIQLSATVTLKKSNQAIKTSRDFSSLPLDICMVSPSFFI